MEYKHVIFEKKGSLAWITLNRPEKLNAIDWPGQEGICDDFFDALREVEEDDELKVVIIKGAGRAFCAGQDLSTVGFVFGTGTGESRRRNEPVSR